MEFEDLKNRDCESLPRQPHGWQGYAPRKGASALGRDGASKAPQGTRSSSKGATPSQDSIGGKTVLEDDIEAVKRFLVEEANKKLVCAPKIASDIDKACSVYDLCDRLYSLIYPADCEAAKPKDGVFMMHELSLRKNSIWYSAEGLGLKPNALPYRFTGQYDPVSEILMSPDIYSIQDAEDEFARIFVSPALADKNPVMRGAGLLARLAFRDMCLCLMDDECKDVYPVLILTDNLVDMASVLNDGAEADREMALRFGEDLLPELAESRDSVRLAIKDGLVKISRFISTVRSEFHRAGICSFWGDDSANVLIDTDMMSLPSIKTATQLLQLYNCRHILALPSKWKNKAAADRLLVDDVKYSNVHIEAQDGISSELCLFPTVSLHKIREKLAAKNPCAAARLELIEPESDGEKIKFLLLGEKPENEVYEGGIIFDDGSMTDEEMDRLTDILMRRPKPKKDD